MDRSSRNRPTLRTQAVATVVAMQAVAAAFFIGDVIADVRADLEKRGALPSDEEAAEGVMAEEVRDRLRRSGRTNVSRAVSDLVRVGLLRRHYRGYRVDHHNRGAGREAVYTLTPAAKQALGKER